MKKDYWDNINERPIWVAGTVHLPLTKDEIKVLENILDTVLDIQVGLKKTSRSYTLSLQHNRLNSQAEKCSIVANWADTTL